MSHPANIFNIMNQKYFEHFDFFDFCFDFDPDVEKKTLFSHL
jgi:hypothetical protein